MKQYTLAQIWKDTSLLEELPIELTKYGKVIAVLQSPNVLEQLQEKQTPAETAQNVLEQSLPPEETIQKRQTQSQQETNNFVQHPMNGQKSIVTCQHGAAVGLCRFGCKS